MKIEEQEPRKQSACKLADEAARAEAHEAAAFAAEAVRRDHGDAQRAYDAYDAEWHATYDESREFCETAMLALLAAYDAEKHPASVTAATLADAVLEARDPQDAIDARCGNNRRRARDPHPTGGEDPRGLPGRPRAELTPATPHNRAARGRA